MVQVARTRLLVAPSCAITGEKARGFRHQDIFGCEEWNTTLMEMC